MKKIGTWIALLASVLLLASCGHHRHHHPGGPGGPGGPMGPMGPMGSVLTSGRADVGLATVGGEALPVVNREPLVIDRATLKEGELPTAHWTLSGPPRETGTLSIRVTGYAALADNAPLDALKKRLKERLPAECPLADKPRESGANCTCTSNGPTASCTFRSRSKAVFTYDICVTTPGGKPACVDPTGMIF